MSVGEALVYAERCCTEGRLAEAEAVCRRVLQALPGTAVAISLLGFIAHRNGKLADAIDHMRRAAELEPQVALYHANLAEMCRLAGRLDDAVAAGRRAVALNPRYPAALTNLGIALFDQGKFEDALALYDQAIAIRDDFAPTHSNRGNALQRLKRFDEAEAAYRRAIALFPDFRDAWNNLGACLRELKRPQEAAAAHRKVLALTPDDPHTLDNLALALKDLEQLDEAAAVLRRAIAIDASRDKYHLHYGSVLLAQDQIEEAAAETERALALDPNNHESANLMGRIAFARGDLGAALAHYRRALSIKPDLADAHNNMGNALKELGRLSDARNAYLEALRLDAGMTGVYLNLSDSKTFTPDDPHLAAMEALAANADGLSASDRMKLDFALGKAYADVKDYGRSFRHLVAGNASKRKSISYDEKSVFALFDRIEKVFRPELIAVKSGHGDPSRVPIFIVGMPRSGTTLIEQIIASHPLVHGAGELHTLDEVIRSVRAPDGGLSAFPEFVGAINARGLQMIGARYVALLRERAAKDGKPDTPHITDKMPSNYCYAGLIHLVLPNAKIVHTVRYPVDNCISCFSKLFVAEQDHTYDLGELGRYYRRYQRLMAHWRRVLPAGRILDVQYEDVVADLESQARRIIAHCGLPWDDRCLSFHATERPVRTASASQVRQPIYESSVGRWRAYEEHIGPLLNALGIDQEVPPPPDSA